jgi:hypothetical protein
MKEIAFDWEEASGGTLFDSEGVPSVIALDRRDGKAIPRIAASMIQMLPHSYRLLVKSEKTGCWKGHLLKWPVSQVGGDMAIQIDGAGRSHIAFIERIDTTRGILYYFIFDGVSLVERTRLSTDNPNPHFVALALDHRDRAEILVYAGSPRRDLAFFRRSGSAWNNWKTGTIDADGATGYFVSMTSDPSGKMHAAYHNNENFSLRYASREKSAEWIVQDAPVELFNPQDPLSQAPGYYPCIRTDSAGNPFIASTTNGNREHPETGEVRLAWKAQDGEWRVRTVKDTVPRASPVSLVVRDEQGKTAVSVLYQDVKHNLILAHSENEDFSKWKYQSILEDSPEFLSAPTMVYDENSDTFHIAAGRRFGLFDSRVYYGRSRVATSASSSDGKQGTQRPSSGHDSVPIRSIAGDGDEVDLPLDLGHESALPEGEYRWPSFAEPAKDAEAGSC